MVGITKEKIDVSTPLKEAAAGTSGAIVTFVGKVRSEEGVEGLELKTDETTGKASLEKIADEAKKRFGLSSVEVVHRVGEVSVGDTVLVVVAAAGDRSSAFQACDYIIEEIKERDVITKRALLPA
ncbi:molybdenum cofactor biosynthesis protein MoaE [uncultured Methanofollis sp.]|uniref:molybdenum cofactor biosynthesis protein MoaE n=1 Tax=uncultured Methanofollis sp. TaxID=262500 RepID=UPI00261A532A|nr:molybdenum cofactor biosynthesis protein MoaE [uncultured Methanofollis sp.]